MSVSVENISNVERRLTITVPAEQVEQAVAKQLNKVAKSANIKGFRPGKAPRDVIEKRFGKDARIDVINELMQKALYEALVAQNLRPVSQPLVQPKTILANQPLEFIASFEVLPEIKQVNFSMDNIEKLIVEVRPDDVNYVIEQLKRQSTKWTLVDRAAKLKDRVVIDYYAIFEEKSDLENKIQNYPLELGSKVMLPGFEDSLIGVKAGEERTLNLRFPTDFNVAERAGKPIDFVVNVKQVFEADVPTMDAAFLQKLGIKSGNEQDLLDQIKQSLEQERDRLVKEKLKDQLFRRVLELNEIEVPKALIANEAKTIHDEVYPNHQHHDHDQHGHSEEETATFNDIAKKRVCLGLLISEFAKQRELKLDQERVTQRIKEIASVYENPPEVIEWLSSDERRKGIEAQVMEDQVMDKLLEGVPVIEKSMTYAELKGVQV